MTLPASGALSLSAVNTEVGATSDASRSLDWVRTNTYYAYENMNALHNLTWFQAVSSQNSVTRSAGSTVTNCANGAPGNCDQCGYSHGQYLQANCNCNCNCANCNCDCDCQCACDACSCFPAGTSVTLEDGSYLPIERIAVGMRVRGATQINTVVAIEYPLLGSRPLMGMSDGSLLWSAEHPLWARRDGRQWWLTCSYTYWIREVETDHIRGLKDNASIFKWEGGWEEFAHRDGWVKRLPTYVSGAIAMPQLQLYFIVTDGDKTLFANDYLVTGGTDEFAVDYTKFNWPNGGK